MFSSFAQLVRNPFVVRLKHYVLSFVSCNICLICLPSASVILPEYLQETSHSIPCCTYLRPPHHATPQPADSAVSLDSLGRMPAEW